MPVCLSLSIHEKGHIWEDTVDLTLFMFVPGVHSGPSDPNHDGQ